MEPKWTKRALQYFLYFHKASGIFEIFKIGLKSKYKEKVKNRNRKEFKKKNYNLSLPRPSPALLFSLPPAQPHCSIPPRPKCGPTVAPYHFVPVPVVFLIV